MKHLILLDRILGSTYDFKIFARLMCENIEKVIHNREITTKVQKTLDTVEVPTTCCMSGCANCVWLDYAEKLNEYFKDGGEKAIKEIEEKITDANVKSFLLHEIRMRNKK